jgi:hypothetical protein
MDEYEYNILLDVIKDVEKFKDIDDFEKLDNVYNINLKNKIASIIHQFLNLIESYNGSKSDFIKYKIVGSAFMFNWMLSHRVKLNIFIKHNLPFGKVFTNKLEELRSEHRLDGCKYWKGVDVYKKYLL